MFTDLLKAVRSGRKWLRHLLCGHLWRIACVVVVLMAVGCAVPQPTGSGTEVVGQNAGSQNVDECFGFQPVKDGSADNTGFQGPDPNISMNSEAQQHFEEGLAFLAQVGTNPLIDALLNPRPLGELPKVTWVENPAQAAYDSFTKAIEVDSSFVGAYVHRALVSYALEKEQEDILADLDMAVKLRPDYAAAWQNRANHLFQMTRMADAARSLDCALAIDPDYFPALWQRGVYHKNSAEWQLAVEDLSRAIEYMPEDFGYDAREIYFDRGVAYLNLEQWEDAASDFTKVIELDDQAVSAWLNRAIVREKMRDVEGAVADYNHILELDLSSIPSIKQRLPQLNELLATLNEGSPEYAGLKDLIGRVDQTTDEAKRYFEEGMEFLAAGPQFGFWQPDYRNLVSAAESFSKAIALNPGAAEYYYRRAEANMQAQADYQIVLPDLDKTIELDDKNADAHYKRAVIMLNLEDDANALLDLDRTIELNPTYFEAHVLRARLYMRQEDPDAAFPDILQAIETMPENTDPNLAYELYDYRATAYYKQENWEGVIADQTKLIEIYAHPVNYLVRGTAYMKLGDAEAAVADLSKTMEMNQGYIPTVQDMLPDLQGLLTTLTPDSAGYKQLDDLIRKVIPGGKLVRCAEWEKQLYTIQLPAISTENVDWNADTLYMFETAVDFFVLSTECMSEADKEFLFPTLVGFNTEFRKALDKLEPGTDAYIRLEEMINRLDEAVSNQGAETGEQQPQLIGQ